jgi:hypothetical protein
VHCHQSSPLWYIIERIIAYLQPLKEKNANLYVLDEHLMQEEETERERGEKERNQEKADSCHKQVKQLVLFWHFRKMIS